MGFFYLQGEIYLNHHILTGVTLYIVELAKMSAETWTQGQRHPCIQVVESNT